MVHEILLLFLLQSLQLGFTLLQVHFILVGGVGIDTLLQQLSDLVLLLDDVLLANTDLIED